MTDERLKKAIEIYNSITDKDITDNYKVEYKTDIYFLKALIAFTGVTKPDDDGYYQMGQTTAELISSKQLKGGTVTLASTRLAANNQIDYKFEYGRRNYKLKGNEKDETVGKLLKLLKEEGIL